MKRMFTKIFIIILLLQIAFMINNISHAAGFWEDIFNFGDNFVNQGKQQAEEGNIVVEQQDQQSEIVIGLPGDEDIKTIISDLYNVLFPIGVVVTVAIGGAIGIKFMMASAEDKAKVKESMMPYVIGCAVIYGAFLIWSIAVRILTI